MRKLIIILSLLLVVFADCQGQDQYYQITTDSALAFRMAFASMPLDTMLPEPRPPFKTCNKLLLASGISLGIGLGFVAIHAETHGTSIEDSFENFPRPITVWLGAAGIIVSAFLLPAALVCYPLQGIKQIIKKKKAGIPRPGS